MVSPVKEGHPPFIIIIIIADIGHTIQVYADFNGTGFMFLIHQ